ncbi:MAG: zf-HC2 domain-containing protein, partial [Sedimentisphaerales bacterium]|nr:zf-HC2 domain-containing protein [Sedimentisphaerales bacterium]
MNEHKKIKKSLVDYALGELPQEQTSTVQTHLAECSECGSEFKLIKALLECTDQISKSSPDKRVCDSARQAILQNVENQKIKQNSGLIMSLEYIRKTIMKSPIIKIAAAAVIIIAAAIILHNGSIDLAGTTYAQMRENIRKMPWVHIITQGIYEGQEVEMEQWFSDEESIIALKKPGGELGFSDYKKGRRYIYDPNTRVISLSFIEPSEYPKNAIPLQNGIDSMLSMLTQQQADIVHRSGRFQGEKVEIYDLEYKVGKITINGRINVDPRSRLPISCEYESTDDEGNQATAWMRFEFPEKGPKNIYDIGAPDSAKAPDGDLQDVLETYLSHRNNCPQRYIAIVTEEQWYDKIRYLDIIFNDGKTQSKEKLSTDEFKEQWMKYAGQKDVSFDDMLELAQKGGNEYSHISLYTDGKSYWTYRSK